MSRSLPHSDASGSACLGRSSKLSEVVFMEGPVEFILDCNASALGYPGPFAVANYFAVKSLLLATLRVGTQVRTLCVARPLPSTTAPARHAERARRGFPRSAWEPGVFHRAASNPVSRWRSPTHDSPVPPLPKDPGSQSPEGVVHDVQVVGVEAVAESVDGRQDNFEYPRPQ